MCATGDGAEETPVRRRWKLAGAVSWCGEGCPPGNNMVNITPREADTQTSYTNSARTPTRISTHFQDASKHAPGWLLGVLVTKQAQHSVQSHVKEALGLLLGRREVVCEDACLCVAALACQRGAHRCQCAWLVCATDCLNTCGELEGHGGV